MENNLIFKLTTDDPEFENFHELYFDSIDAVKMFIFVNEKILDRKINFKKESIALFDIETIIKILENSKGIKITRINLQTPKDIHKN